MVERQARRRLVRRARKLARQAFGYELDTPGVCLPLAWATCEIGRRMGLQLRMYAGSCFWQRSASGRIFGYEWEGLTAENQARLARGVLPELHVWAGCPETTEWIDLSTPLWPAQCRALIGESWSTPMPDYLWSRVDQLPQGAVYEPSAEAGRIMVAYLTRRSEEQARNLQGNMT